MRWRVSSSYTSIVRMKYSSTETAWAPPEIKEAKLCLGLLDTKQIKENWHNRKHRMQLIILMWSIYSLKSLITHLCVIINLYYTNTRVYSYNINFFITSHFRICTEFYGDYEFWSPCKCLLRFLITMHVTPIKGKIEIIHIIKVGPVAQLV